MYIKIELICSTTSRRICMLKGSKKDMLGTPHNKKIYQMHVQERKTKTEK